MGRLARLSKIGNGAALSTGGAANPPPLAIARCSNAALYARRDEPGRSASCSSSPPCSAWRAFAYVAHRWVMHGPGWFLHASHHRAAHRQLGAQRSLRGDLRGAVDRAAARRRAARLVAGLRLDRRGDRGLWRDLFRVPRRHRPSPHRDALSAAIGLYEAHRPGAPAAPCRSRPSTARSASASCGRRGPRRSRPSSSAATVPACARRAPTRPSIERTRALLRAGDSGGDPARPVQGRVRRDGRAVAADPGAGDLAGAAAAILLPVLIVQDVVGVWAFRRTWDGYVLGWMLPGAVIGIALGWSFAAQRVGRRGARAGRRDLDRVRRCIGCGSSAAARSPRRRARPAGSARCSASRRASPARSRMPASRRFRSGCCRAGSTRDVLVGTTAIFFAATNWLKVPAYWALGQFTPRESADASASAAAGRDRLDLGRASGWCGACRRRGSTPRSTC